MVRPAGPRISSIRPSTLSPGMKEASRRWVCSNEPMIAPAPRHAGDELDQQVLDHRGGDGAEAGHGLGDLLDLLLVERLPQRVVLLAEGEQDDGGLLRPGQPAGSTIAFLLRRAAHAVSCSQLRRIETDSSGCFSTNSATCLTEEAFTWPSILAMSMRWSISPGRAGPAAAPVCGSTAICTGWPPPAAMQPGRRRPPAHGQHGRRAAAAAGAASSAAGPRRRSSAGRRPAGRRARRRA